MIYLFTGNSDYLVKQQTSAWKNKFLEKFGDFNLIHIKDLSKYDNVFLNTNLTAYSFFDSKKLIIIDDIPLSGTIKDSGLKEKQDYIMGLLDSIPDNNIVLFSSVNPDKRGKLYKKLKKIAEVKEFNIKDDFVLKNTLKTKYKEKITDLGIDTIIKYKSKNLDKIISEIDKLLIIFNKVDKKEVVENIVPELEESIFQFIDELLNLNITNVMKKLDIILEQTNIYGFYNNLIANLRTQIYINILKNKNKNSNISDILLLGNRGFLVNKNYKISTKKLEKLYISLINLDKKMKTGNMVGTQEKDFRYEIENVILKLL